MTSTNGDVFHFNGRQYVLLEQDAPFGFYPYEHDIIPEAITDTYPRGYWCTYRVLGDGIFLYEVYINSKNGYYPEINGVLASDEKENESLYPGHHAYKEINLRLPFTGRLLLGDGYVGDEFGYIGYVRPWTYETLIELIFDDGKLLDVVDHSRTAAEMRQKQAEADKRVNDAYENEGRIIFDNLKVNFGVDVWWMK